MEINKIYNEDCLVTMGKMPDGFVGLTVTSPPYDNLRDYKGYSFQFEKVAKELFRVTKKGGVVVWVVGDATINGSETGTSFKQALYFIGCGFNLHDTMIYAKNPRFPEQTRYNQCFEYMFILSKNGVKTFNPIKRKNESKNLNRVVSDRGKNGELIKKKIVFNKESLKYNFWFYDCGGVEEANGHPAIFPEKLAADHIISWSNKGDMVYDPFMGSGTTAKMAHIHQRNWIGSEISKEYTELAEKRIKPYLQTQQLF